MYLFAAFRRVFFAFTAGHATIHPGGRLSCQLTLASSRGPTLSRMNQRLLLRASHFDLFASGAIS